MAENDRYEKADKTLDNFLDAIFSTSHKSGFKLPRSKGSNIIKVQYPKKDKAGLIFMPHI